MSVDLAARIDAAFALDPAAPALQYDGTWWTWADLDAVQAGIRDARRNAGVHDDATPAVVVRNRPAVAAAVLGVLRSRRGYVSVNAMYPDAAVADDLATLGAEVVVGMADDLARAGVAEAVERAGGLVVRLPERPGDAVTVGSPNGARPAGVALPDGVAVSMTSSGTTGKAKRVLLRHDHLLATVIEAQEHAGSDTGVPTRTGRGVGILSAPLAHIGGVFGLLMGVTRARPAALLDRFDPHRWAALVAEHGVISSGLPPAAMRLVLDAGIPKEQLASLRVVSSGTAPLPAELAVRFEEAYGVPVLQAYGATEFAGGLSSFTAADRRKWGDAKRGSVGRAHPGVEFRIVDPDDGRDLPAGDVGLLLVRTSHTAAAVDDEGWTRTNDLARLDEDGYLYIHGRADDVIIRGGFKIDLLAVEATLSAHPAVQEAAVVPAPHERLGQVPVAAVVPKAGVPAPSTEELAQWVRDRLAPYAVPVAMAVVDELPRNPTLKVVRSEVVDLVLGS